MTVKIINKPGNKTSHQWLRNCARDWVINNPHSTSGCLAPSPIKDSPEAIKIAYPASMVPWTSIGPMLFGKICFFMMCNLPAPILFETETYPEDKIIIACDLAIRTYQGNQDIDIPMITLFREGPKTEVIISGNISGGNARNPSVMRIKTSSIFLLETPENIPIGTPMAIDSNTTENATFKEERPA